MSKHQLHQTMSVIGCEVNDSIKHWITDGNHDERINSTQREGNYCMAIPTSEHYISLLYVLAK